MADDYYQASNQTSGTPDPDQPAEGTPANTDPPVTESTDFAAPSQPPISQDTPTEKVADATPTDEKPAEMPAPIEEPEPVAEPSTEPPVEEPNNEDPTPQPAVEPKISAPEEPKPDDTKAPEPTPPEAAKKAKTPEEAYDIFVDQLLKDLGFEKLQEPKRSELIDAIKLRVEARILRVLITSLSKEQAEEFEKEIEEKGLSQEQIIKLLAEKSPNSSAAILSALDDLYSEMKEETELLWKVAAAQSVAEGAQKVEDQKGNETPAA